MAYLYGSLPARGHGHLASARGEPAIAARVPRATALARRAEPDFVRALGAARPPSRALLGGGFVAWAAEVSLLELDRGGPAPSC